jgi:ligand-binding sensor domain-containing protein/signal transduction histidine kinase
MRASREISRLLLLVAAFLFFAVPARALDPRKAITQYQQDFWTEEDGLPQASVQAITQTHDGYIWIGTRDGLARFDGTRFKIFRSEEYSALLSDDIRSLFEDREGRLWIGTFNGGLACYTNGTFHSYLTRDGLASSGVLEIFQDSAGALWFGTWRGIVKFADGKFESFQQGLSGSAVWSIWEDRDKSLWAATGRMVHKFTDGKFAPISGWLGVNPVEARKVFTDRHGGTWMVTLEGLIHAAPNETKGRNVDGLPDTRVRTITQDTDGNIWVGTFGGLCRIQNGHIATFPTASGERLNGLIETLFVDRDGSLWIGIRGSGLARLRDARFSNFTTREGLPTNLPRAVFQASDGAIWIGGDGGGLARVQGEKVETLGKSDGLPSDFIVSVAEAKDGTIWAGFGRPPAIAAIRGNRVEKVITKRDGLDFDYSVRALLIDQQGTVWAGGDGGLYFLRDGQLTQVAGISEPPVRVVQQDRQGRIWAAAEQGLCLIEDGKVKRVFTVRDGLSHNAVYSIFEDHDGALWLGTQQGLTRYANGKFQAWTRSKGGFQGTVYTALEDDDGGFWISSSRGIWTMKKKDLEAAIEGRGSAVEPVTYSTADGLKSTQGQGASQVPAFKTRDGRLWFATLNGVAVISPRESDPHRNPPPVLIEEVWANRALYSPREQNIFAADTDDFEIHYTALKFITPERAQFRYQLVGQDKEWIYAKGRRAAYYSNLRPGQFTFRVAASSDGVVWGEPVEMAPFRLKPHFYQTIWFYLLCLAAAVFAGWTFHRHRLKKAEEEFALVLAERTRIARDLHDTLAQGFAGTAFQLEALRTNLAHAEPKTKRHLELALTMVRHSFTEAKRAVMNLRSPMFQSGDVIAAVTLMAEQILGETGVEVVIRVIGKAPGFTAETQNQLPRICQEAFANILKHAKATRVEIVFDFSGEAALVSIRDNGVGFDVDGTTRRNGHHFGIQGMNERMKQVGGKLEIKSAPGDGAEILIRVNEV